MNLFDWDKPLLKITKPVRLIELFAGIGAQAKAFQRLCVPFEHYGCTTKYCSNCGAKMKGRC